MRWLISVVAIGLFVPNCQCDNNAGGADAPGEFSCDPACTADLVCRYDECIPPPTSCTANADCPGDQYCVVSRMECLP